MPCYAECSKQQSGYIVQPPIFDSLNAPVLDEFDSVDSLNDSTLSALAPNKNNEQQPQIAAEKKSSSSAASVSEKQQSSGEEPVEPSPQKQQSQTCCCGGTTTNQSQAQQQPQPQPQQQQQRSSTTNQPQQPEAPQKQQTSASSKQVNQHLNGQRGYQTMPRLNESGKPKQAFLNQVHLNPPPRYLPQPPIQAKMATFLPPLAPHAAPYISQQALINQATMINRYQAAAAAYNRQQQMMNGAMIPALNLNAFDASNAFCRQLEFQPQMPLYSSFQAVRQDGMPIQQQIQPMQQQPQQQQQQGPIEFDMLNQMPMQYADRNYGTPTMRRRNAPTPPPMPPTGMAGMALPPSCATPPQLTMQQALMRQQQQYNIDPSGIATIQRYRESSTPPAINMNRISMPAAAQQMAIPLQQSPTTTPAEQEQMFAAAAAYALQQQQQQIYQQPQQQTKQQEAQIPYQVYETAQIRYQIAAQQQQQPQQQQQQPIIQNGVITAQQCTFQPQQRNIQQATNDYRAQMILMNQLQQQQQQQQQRYQSQEQLQQQQQQQQQQGQNVPQIQLLPTYTNFDLLLKEIHKAQNVKSKKNSSENNGEKDEKAEKIAANRSHKSLFQWLFSSNKSKDSNNNTLSLNKLEHELPQQFIIADFKYR